MMPLWDPPPAVVSPSPHLVSTPFAKFLQYRVFQYRDMQVGILNGPGHDCAAVAAVVLDEQLRPHMVLKSGDARICRVLRGDDYLKPGCVAGRLDKQGANAARIALAELSEEVGGEPVSFRSLGDWLTPTMPHESSEADANFFSLIALKATAQGDGGGMEVAGLIGPVFMSFSEGFAAMEDGRIGEAGRAQSLYRRAADSIGYLPELDVWVEDHPRLLERYRTLGLGPLQDARQGQRGAALPPDFEPTLAIDGASWVSRQDHPVGEGMLLADGQTVHTAGGAPVGKPFTNQILVLDYDRAKVVHYALTQDGPMVEFGSRPSPVMAIKGLLLGSERWLAQENHDAHRRDVEDLKIGRGQVLPYERLGEPCGASSGQADLYYHFYAVRESARPDWIPLSQALELCRTGQGDGQTEAALHRLAHRLHWLPTLDLSVDQARALLQG